MRKVEPELSMGDKILIAIYELDKLRKEGRKITKEEMVVHVWKKFPADFCIKGYPEYPNADISKYVTTLFKQNFLKGSFYNYIITPKGREYAEQILAGKPIKNKQAISSSRQIESEIRRIRNSKVFQLFLKGEKDFIESDLFEFLGTSSRSLSAQNRTAFISNYTLITKEVIPFCNKLRNNDPEAAKIADLWNILREKFTDLLTKKIKVET